MLDLPSYASFNGDVLPHELSHAWSGKYRRPAGLATPDYQTPLKFDLIWIYEGLTNYLGDVLAARSGIFTRQDFLDLMAQLSGNMESRMGRSWRSLADLSVSAPLPTDAAPQGRA